MAKQTWWAEKANGDIIDLTEIEALTHFEDNNISRRMRLRFIGTSSGKHQEEAKEKIRQLIIENRPDNFQSFVGEDGQAQKNLIDAEIRADHAAEIREILAEAKSKELEEAKQNGVKRPDKSLRVSTKANGEYGREETLRAMGNM